MEMARKELKDKFKHKSVNLKLCLNLMSNLAEENSCIYSHYVLLRDSATRASANREDTQAA